MNKRDVLAVIDELPEEIDLQDLMHRLYVLQRIEEGERDEAAGRFVPHDEAMRAIRRWQR